MSIVTKGKILRQDIEHFDGVNKTAVRKDSTGGTVSGLVVGYEVDVLASYGNGENYTWQTVDDCVRRIGSASVTLIFNPGTWTIDQNLTIGSNFTCRIPAGCVFSVSSGKTLTFSGPVIRDSSTWTSGSGTVTENGTRTFTGLIDLTGAVIQGTNALVFEGSTANAYETTFVITNPTADRTITIPDADVDLSSIPSTSGNNTWSGNNAYSGTITMTGSSLWFAEGAAVASATTPSASPIWATDGNTIGVTGTTTITGFAAAPQAGAIKRLVFDGALILTNGANLICPGSANITTAAGDSCIVYADTTTQHRIFDYTRANGTPVIPTAFSSYPTSRLFISSEQTLTANSDLAVAHSLGAVPTMFTVSIRCKTAEYGYSINDEVLLITSNTSIEESCGYVNATNIGFVLSVDVRIVDRTGGVVGTVRTITLASWKAVLRAWA
jgi:hypothetical protein